MANASQDEQTSPRGLGIILVDPPGTGKNLLGRAAAGEHDAVASGFRAEAADVLQLAKVRMLKALERRDMVRLTPEALEVDDTLAARERALVRDPESIERFLRHQNLWSSPKGLAPARAPPYHRQVTCLAPTRQQELFIDT